jgi:putative spermidine/putrescine transport system permease protein
VRTFAEVTLPLVWTGVFGALLFGFTLTWNDYDRTVLNVVGDPTLPLRIVGLIQESALRPDLYALGTATTAVSLALVAVLLIVVLVRSRFSRAPVESREEELGLGGGIDAEAAEQVVEA